MERYLSWVERTTSAYLTKRRAMRLYEKNQKKHRTVKGEILGWIDAILFAVVFVFILNLYIFQFFIIPSPSMETTLLVGDRVYVSKNSYGMEMYPGSKKLFTRNRPVSRDDIITFYNPEYQSKGPVFDTVAQMLYMGTFSLVNIDRNEDGSMAERLYVKRAAGMGGDTVTFKDGYAQIRPAGFDSFMDERDFRNENSLNTNQQRLIDEDYYTGLNAYAKLEAYAEMGIDVNDPNLVPSYLFRDMQKIQNEKYIKDMYGYDKEVKMNKSSIAPADFYLKSDAGAYQAGIYVPQGSILPLGDNRDNSRDGRYFGPVDTSHVNGRVLARMWPLSRIDYLGDK